jgi:hypothetical protein
MKDPANPIVPSWTPSPTVKAKNAVQRNVTALLDELAPEKVLKRADQIKGPVEQHRTPNGCVLQGATAAVSVSWFADPVDEAVLGELHVIVWSGTVTHRGQPKSRVGATVVSDHVLRPIEPPVNECVWLAVDGTRYDTASLAAKCLALLAEQSA